MLNVECKDSIFRNMSCPEIGGQKNMAKKGLTDIPQNFAICHRIINGLLLIIRSDFYILHHKKRITL